MLEEGNSPMFVVTYAYEVPENEVNRYLGIQKRVKGIYVNYGCIGYEVLKSSDDCWLEINKFKDREHYETVKKSIDADPEIDLLWKEFRSIVEEEKIITRQYEKIL